MRYLFQTITLSFLVFFTNAIKVAVLSDMHLQPFYNPNISADQYCQNRFPV